MASRYRFEVHLRVHCEFSAFEPDEVVDGSETLSFVARAIDTTVVPGVMLEDEDEYDDDDVEDPRFRTDLKEVAAYWNGCVIDRTALQMGFFEAADADGDLLRASSIYFDESGRKRHPTLSAQAGRGTFLYLDSDHVGGEAEVSVQLLLHVLRFFGIGPPLPAGQATTTTSNATIVVCELVATRRPSVLVSILRAGFKQLGRTEHEYSLFHIDAGVPNATNFITHPLTADQVNALDTYQWERAPGNIELAKLEAEYVTNHLTVSEVVTRVNALGIDIGTTNFLHFAVANDELSTRGDVTEWAKRGISLTKQDADGNTPFHVVVTISSSPSPGMRTLIELGRAAGISGIDLKNAAGKTPADMLALDRQSTRDFSASMGLQGIKAGMGMTAQKAWETSGGGGFLEMVPMVLSPHTLNTVIDGWLSPRMCEALIITAEIAADGAEDEMDGFTAREARHIDDVFVPALDYIPRIGEEVYKSMVGAVANCLRAIVAELKGAKERKGAPPYVQVARIRQRFVDLDARYAAHMAGRGASLDHILDYVIHKTANILRSGNGLWDLETFEDQINAHPATLLDNEVDVVRYKLLTERNPHLLEANVPRGPYRR
eukprot:TRINITY_DN5274_c0_g1_i1.p1 TRINITY_DN5274_c0_g1~~TRINITY_DN5274_c0_g1_i1.p1  ORF type:complete len:619 (+),score=115.43 TRINITY_DN5274_c0_g1_i1:50-1858(+)